MPIVICLVSLVFALCRRVLTLNYFRVVKKLSNVQISIISAWNLFIELPFSKCCSPHLYCSCTSPGFNNSRWNDGHHINDGKGRRSLLCLHSWCKIPLFYKGYLLTQGTLQMYNKISLSVFLAFIITYP